MRYVIQCSFMVDKRDVKCLIFQWGSTSAELLNSAHSGSVLVFLDVRLYYLGRSAGQLITGSSEKTNLKRTMLKIPGNVSRSAAPPDVCSHARLCWGMRPGSGSRDQPCPFQGRGGASTTGRQF